MIIGGIIKQFRKIDSPDRILNTFQENVADTFEEITPKEILDGQLIEADVASGVNVIQHRLGRPYVGWIVVRSTLANTITFADEDRPNRNITLNASTSSKVWIWVF